MFQLRICLMHLGFGFPNPFLGYLYIAAVIEDDHDTTYTCVANNEVLRYQKSGPSYRIQIYGQQVSCLCFGCVFDFVL